MEFGVLGPVIVTNGSGPVDIGGPRQRRLLAGLVTEPGRTVPTGRLVEIVFDGSPTERSTTTIRSYVARLRRALDAEHDGPESLVSTEPGGYRLNADPTQIDAERFRIALHAAIQERDSRDPIAAVSTLRDALTLWRGDPFGEFGLEEWAVPEARRLEELHIQAHEELHEALLECGRDDDVVAATRSLTEKHTLRERLWEQRALALHRSGRHAEAIRCLDQLRSHLADVGLEPSGGIVQLERSLAVQDPALLLDSPAGQSLRGYRLGDEIGSGPVGTVHRAIQPGVGREVAIKVIRAGIADDPAFVRRFHAEVQRVAHVEHPHIVPIHDFWREPGAAYVVMRLMPADLTSWIELGPMALRNVVAVVRDLGSALTALHAAGLTHGDLTPRNVLVDSDRTYLSDAGAAALVNDPSASAAAYAAPEVHNGVRGPAADQYSLAVLAAELLTGILPYGSGGSSSPNESLPSIHRRRPSVPSEIDDVLARGTAWQPSERWSDVATFVAEFDAAMGADDRPKRAPTAQGANPYKGLRAFSEVDSQEFFGRDVVVDELIDRLRSPGDTGRVLAVIGASGSGKSSVVRAGLLPKVRAGAISGSEHWYVATMVPGTDPFIELDAALRPISRASSESRPLSLGHRQRVDGAVVVELLRRALPDAGAAVVLVVDQFEELFTLVDDENVRRGFIDGLAEAVRYSGLDVRVVLTIRADFLDRPLRYAELGRMIKDGATTLVGMSASELEAAITEPASGEGVDVEHGLVAELVADVIDQPAALPLLQFTLAELYDRRSGSVMSLSSYVALGGVEGSVARRAEELHHRLADTDIRLMDRLFLRLVAVDDDGSVGRRSVARSELVAMADDPASVDRILDAFGAARLLSFDRDQDSREPTVEIAHEALIRHWPRFAEWVADAGDALRVRARTAEAARAWEAQGRDDSELLRGLRLESAIDVARLRPELLSPLEHELVDASDQARRDQLAAESTRIERERRTSRRLRLLLVGAAALLLIAVLAGLVAVRNERRAEVAAADALDRTAEAELATLVSRAAAARAEDPELALLLALEAHRRASTEATAAAVIGATGGAPIGHRIASWQLDSGWCRSAFPVGFGGEVGFGNLAGQMVTFDLLTGEATDIGAAPADCVTGWSEGDRGWATNEAFDRHWFGADRAVEVQFDSPVLPLGMTDDRAIVRGRATSQLGIEDDGGISHLDAVRVFDMRTGTPVGPPIALSDLLLSAATSDSSSLAALGSAALDGVGGAVLVVDLASGERVIEMATETPPTAVTFEESTGHLVVGYGRGRLATFDPMTGELLTDLDSGLGGINALGVRPDGNVIAVGERTIQLLDRRRGATRPSVALSGIVGENLEGVEFVGYDFEPDLRAFVRSDGLVATVSSTGSVEVYDVDGRSLVGPSHPSGDGIVSIANGRAAIVDPTGTRVETVVLSTGQRMSFDLTSPDRATEIAAIAAHPEPDGVLTVSQDLVIVRRTIEGAITSLDLGDPTGASAPGTARRSLSDRVGVYQAVLGQTSSRGYVAVVLDVGPDVPVVRFATSLASYSVLTPGPGGELYAVDENGVLRSYDPDGALASIRSIGAVSPTDIELIAERGSLVVTSQLAGIVLVDLATDETTVLPGQQSVVTTAGRGVDASRLVSIAADGSARVHSDDPASPPAVAVRGDGVISRAAGWYDAGLRSVWVTVGAEIVAVPVDPTRWIDRACEAVGRDLTVDEWERLVPGEEPHRLQCG